MFPKHCLLTSNPVKIRAGHSTQLSWTPGNLQGRHTLLLLLASQVQLGLEPYNSLLTD